MKRSSLIICLLLAFIISCSLILVWNIPSIKLHNKSKEGSSAQSLSAKKRPLYWIDPMEPNVHYPGPGTSHMGMTLVPAFPKADADDKKGIHISPAVIENLGIRTALVSKGALAKKIETVGYIKPDENLISHIHTYAEGWIQKLQVRTVAAHVRKGQLLFQYYSPVLVNAEEEYLLALESNYQSLIAAAYQKLKALNINESQIQSIKIKHHVDKLINVYAPQNGIVDQLNVREGMHVLPEMEIMSLIDLSEVWMIGQIYEQQASWVKVGDSAQATFSAFPGKVWRGKVEYVYPEIDPVTRTLKVRLRFTNAKEVLKPNMYADLTLFVQPKKAALSIPTEALIRNSHGDKVILAVGEGRFQVRPVIVGLESGDRVEILSGLNENDQVVVSGQFLIDSEANLKASLQRLEADKNHD